MITHNSVVIFCCYVYSHVSVVSPQATTSQVRPQTGHIPTAQHQGEGDQMCHVVAQCRPPTPQGLLKCLGGHWILDLPSLLSAPCPSQAGAFPGQRGTVCGLARSQSSQPACLCQPPSPETKDKAGTQPDTPRSPFISPSFPSSSI